MRAIFGLVGLLVGVGVLVWWLGSGGGLEHTEQVLKQGQTARETASQVAGIDTSTGGSAKESATIEVLMAGGKPDSILVTKVTPGGAYDKHFGLKENDTILQIGPLPIKELIKSDDDAEAFLLDAFQRQQALLVVRDGNQLTLPQAPPPGKPASTDGKGSTDPLQQQLDGIGARRGL
jgi:hypothetical protein